jgi:2,4-dienoyl-CoA reductase-like NADH-dependent reductase (Old Yellow Enzyme family)
MKNRTGESLAASLFDPLTVGGLMLKNRIVMPLTANDLASTTGEVTEASIAHYTH